MDRRKFLQRLGFGAAAGVCGQTVGKQVYAAEEPTLHQGRYRFIAVDSGGTFAHAPTGTVGLLEGEDGSRFAMVWNFESGKPVYEVRSF